MKITRFTAQQRNKDRVNVYIDGIYELSLSINDILAQKLHVGIELDTKDIAALKKLSEDSKLYAQALDWTLNRPRSQKELREYLFKKRASSELTEKICKEFAKKGYQNDEVFAKWWIENRLRKNKSDVQIRSELQQKGIRQATIQGLLTATVNAKERIRRIVDQKRTQTLYKDEIKLKQYLIGKGYSYSDVSEVLAERSDGIEESD